MKKILAIALSLTIMFMLAACAPVGGQVTETGDVSGQTDTTPKEVTIEFLQWWEPELPQGELKALMDQFEKENPGIKVTLNSAPYTNIKDQLIIGTASGTLGDVLGLDGVWISDLYKQGTVENLTKLMKDAGYDDSKLVDQTKIEGNTYMIPVVTFAYMLFVNLDMFEAAGITDLPKTQSEFLEAARKVTDPSKNIYGWGVPLQLGNPNGANHDIMPWVWASGGRMLTDDAKPNLVNNPKIKAVYELVKTMYEEGLILPGAFSMDEEDKTHEFINERIATVVNTCAHITMIRSSNPDLDFTVIPIPVEDGYTGENGMDYAPWGIGISSTSKNKMESWKLIEFIMSKDVNSKLASLANAFPGNVDSQPDFSVADELFIKAFELFQNSYLINEFQGLPVSEELQRKFNEEMQKMLDGQQSVDDAIKNTQDIWTELMK